MPGIRNHEGPGKEETSGIRGHMPGIRNHEDPGKEETSGIRGHMPGIRNHKGPGKEETSGIRGLKLSFIWHHMRSNRICEKYWCPQVKRDRD